MNFSCSSCHKTYTIADAKLPDSKKLAFPCPNCGRRIQLDLSREAGAAMTAGVKTAAGAAPSTAPPEPTDAASAPASSDDRQTAEELKQRILRNLNELPPMPQIVFKAHDIMDSAS
ncbi:MAG: zinc-ribbon domain-containing protein, partial [Desulfobacterales bacterium]